MSDWFYSGNGARLGPHTDAEMLNLAQSGQVLADTLCWREDFGATWKPFSQTDLRRPNSSHEPPPLPASHVNSIYAWLYAFVPLIGAIIEQVVIENTSIREIPTGKVILIYVLAYGLLAGLDSKAIERSGNAKVPKAWWFLIAPLYLWFRDRALGQRWKVHFWVMLASFTGAVAISDPEIGRQFFLGTSLPACNSALADGEVTRLFNGLPLIKAWGVSSTGVSGQRETKLEGKMRYCSGVIEGSNSVSYPATYSFEKRTDDVYVRMELK